MNSINEIERMVTEAETYKADDDQQKYRIAAKNSVESFCYNMKSTLEDKVKIPEDDRKSILDKCNETITWLDHNQMANMDEYKDKLKELEGFCNPIITRLYQQQQRTQSNTTGTTIMSCKAQNGPGVSGPTVEEVD